MWFPKINFLRPLWWLFTRTTFLVLLLMSGFLSLTAVAQYQEAAENACRVSEKIDFSTWLVQRSCDWFDQKKNKTLKSFCETSWGDVCVPSCLSLPWSRTKTCELFCWICDELRISAYQQIDLSNENFLDSKKILSEKIIPLANQSSTDLYVENSLALKDWSYAIEFKKDTIIKSTRWNEKLQAAEIDIRPANLSDQIFVNFEASNPWFKINAAIESNLWDWFDSHVLIDGPPVKIELPFPTTQWDQQILIDIHDGRWLQFATNQYTSNPNAICINWVPDRDIVTNFSLDSSWGIWVTYACQFSVWGWGSIAYNCSAPNYTNTCWVTQGWDPVFNCNSSRDPCSVCTGFGPPVSWVCSWAWPTALCCVPTWSPWWSSCPPCFAPWWDVWCTYIGPDWSRCGDNTEETTECIPNPGWDACDLLWTQEVTFTTFICDDRSESCVETVSVYDQECELPDPQGDPCVEDEYVCTTGVCDRWECNEVPDDALCADNTCSESINDTCNANNQLVDYNWDWIENSVTVTNSCVNTCDLSNLPSWCSDCTPICTLPTPVIQCVANVCGAEDPNIPPTIECYETATFNETTCVWDVTWTQPCAGSPRFLQLAKKTNERFQMGEDEHIPCTFSGFSLARGKDGSLEQNQHFYLQKLERLHLDASFSEFRSMRMRLAWLVNTRPDCQFEISQPAQVNEDRYLPEQPEIVRRLNRATRYAAEHRVSLKIAAVDQESLGVVGFADASFANNHDLSTQLGHICFLTDGHSRSVPISFKSYMSKRVVRSAMAGEVIAFSDLFDIAATLASELGDIYGRRIPVQLLAGSKSLFDVISKGSRTSEKRTMLDIGAAREGFGDKVISDIGFIRSSNNIADGLTKSMSQAALQAAVSTGMLAIHPEQWIIRN